MRPKWRSYLHIVFTAASCTIAKLRNQFKCLSAEEWVKKRWYMSAMEFFIHKEMISFVGKWIQLEIIILRELYQFQKGILCFLICAFLILLSVGKSYLYLWHVNKRETALGNKKDKGQEGQKRGGVVGY